MTSPMPAYRRPLPPSTRMQRISLAPVLSATLSRDSCWITSTPAISPRLRSQADLLLGLLEDLGYPPALRRGQRPGLHQQHAVADAAGVGLVVRPVLLGTAQNLAVLGVLDVVLDLDDNRLVHLVADHVTFPALAVTPGFGFAGGVLAHLPASSAASSPAASETPAAAAGGSATGSPASSIRVMIPSSRSRITVYIRAISLRTARSLPWLSSCPVAPWKRRLNSSSLASASLACSSSSEEIRSCAVRLLAISPHPI